MPVFDETTQDKIVELRGLRALGTQIEAYELVEIQWPSPDGTMYYSVLQTDESASVAPPVSPILTRIIPDNNPGWFLPIPIEASVGDEEIDIEMWDEDEHVSQLLVDHGEGVKTIAHYWLPQVALMLPVWEGHLRFEDEAKVDLIKLKVAQGFRSADAIVPYRAHWQECQAVFGGILETLAQILEHDCPYNLHLGGPIGIVNPATGLPWTFCDRKDHASCTARGVDPMFHLSHRTLQTIHYNGQPGGGPQLLITSHGNETNLKDPVRVVMGSRRIYDMKVMAFSIPTPQEQGWFFAMYEGTEGPIQAFRDAQVTVGGITQNVDPLHYNPRLGTRGQTSAGSDLTPHGYSGTSHFRYNFGYVDARNLGPGDATASSQVDGLSNIRVYTDADPAAYTGIYTTNRAWQLARILCDKRWGYGLDYERLDIQSFIDAAAWCSETVRFTDTFGTNWDHVRSTSNVELIGKKVQQQIEDLCMAGRLSRPFLFNGKIHVVPLRALTEDELDDCPVFTDEGESRNIIWEDDKTTLTVSRKSDLDLPNRVECTYDAADNAYLETPLQPVEDIDAQLAAGRVVGDKARKINPKKYPLLGVVYKPQAVKMAWSLLDLGPHDEGGLQNNLSPTFKAWFMDTLDLHQEKVIKIVSPRLTKYGFSYFRVKKMERKEDLTVEIECQAYNETYMDAFEGEIGGGGCSVDADCDDGFVCVGGQCVPEEAFCTIDADCPPGFRCVNGVCEFIEPHCRPGFGGITYDGEMMTIEIPNC